MSTRSNISTTLSEAIAELGLSLKEMEAALSRLRKSQGEIAEACLVCESVWKMLESYAEKQAVVKQRKWWWGPGFHMERIFGLAIFTVSDADALLVPELGTANILLGSRADARKILQYIALLREKGTDVL